MSFYNPPKSETKTTCRHCGRPPGGVHGGACRLGKRYAKVGAFKLPPTVTRRWPIANIFECVGGDLTVKPIPRGTPHRVRL